MFKRNFTFGLASPNTFNDGAAWVPSSSDASSQSWELVRGEPVPVGSDGGDVSAIACAVNTFGQDDVFHASFNGLCFNGRNIPGRGMFPSIVCDAFSFISRVPC